MRQPRQMAVVTRRIDDDVTVIGGQGFDGVEECRACLCLVFGFWELGLLVETDMVRSRQFFAALPRPGQAVVDVMRKAALPAIEVDGGDALAQFQQGDGDMHGNGGFTRSPLFVAYDDHADARRTGWKFLNHCALHCLAGKLGDVLSGISMR